LLASNDGIHNMHGCFASCWWGIRKWKQRGNTIYAQWALAVLKVMRVTNATGRYPDETHASKIEWSKLSQPMTKAGDNWRIKKKAMDKPTAEKSSHCGPID